MDHHGITYNINLVHTTALLSDKAILSPVQMNGSTGEWFRTTVGVWKGCLFSPTLFIIFLERIMSDALEHDGKVRLAYEAWLLPIRAQLFKAS